MKLNYALTAILLLLSVPALAMGKKPPTQPTDPAPTQDPVSQTPSAPSAPAQNTPCAEPNPDAKGLFELIANSSTSVQEIQEYIQSHVVAWDALNDQCHTTVMAAIDQDRTDIYEALYAQYQPDPIALQPQTGESVYSYALRHGTVQLIQLVEQEASSRNEALSLPYNGNSNTTALMWAVSANQSLDVTKYLLSQPYMGISNEVNTQGSESNETALMTAASSNPNADIVKALIAARARVNDTDRDGYTALMYAARFNKNADVIKVLVQAGASVNERNQSGNTALSLAGSNSNPEIAQILTQAGATN